MQEGSVQKGTITSQSPCRASHAKDMTTLVSSAHLERIVVSSPDFERRMKSMSVQQHGRRYKLRDGRTYMHIHAMHTHAMRTHKTTIRRCTLTAMRTKQARYFYLHIILVCTLAHIYSSAHTRRNMHEICSATEEGVPDSSGKITVEAHRVGISCPWRELAAVRRIVRWEACSHLDNTERGGNQWA